MATLEPCQFLPHVARQVSNWGAHSARASLAHDADGTFYSSTRMLRVYVRSISVDLIETRIEPHVLVENRTAVHLSCKREQASQSWDNPLGLVLAFQLNVALDHERAIDTHGGDDGPMH